MATETHVYAPKKLFAGASPDLVTAPGTILSGSNVVLGEIMMSDATGKLLPHSGLDAVTGQADQPVAGIMAFNVDATAGDTPGVVYIAGSFFESELTFPLDANTPLLKRKLLEGSMINIVFQDAGEV